MTERDPIVIIPLPTLDNGVTYGTARLVEDGGQIFAEAIVEIPGTRFAPPRRVSLSRYSLRRLREGAPNRAELYLYEGMILSGPNESLN